MQTKRIFARRMAKETRTPRPLSPEELARAGGGGIGITTWCNNDTGCGGCQWRDDCRDSDSIYPGL